MPKKKDEYSLADIFREIELELVNSFKRNMTRHQAEELKEGKTWEMWQKTALRNLNNYRVRNRKLIKPYSKEVQAIIDEVINETYESTMLNEFEMASDIGFNLPEGSFSADYGVIPPQEQDFFRVNDRKLDALLSEMDTSFSKTEGLILNKMDNVYQNTLDRVAIEMVSGTTTYQQAVDKATKDFLSKGLDVITYKNGRRVNIASYAEMYLRTANQRAKFLAGGRVRDQLGVYTVLMSQHDNCSKMCLPFQGTVLIDDVYTSLTPEDARQLQRETKYQLLSYAMEEYAFHPNCRHNLTTWFPGKSSLPSAKHGKDKEKTLDMYKQEQHQRRLESNLRRWKRIEAGTVDPVEINKAKLKVKKYQGELRDHIKANPDLRRDYWRERLDGIKNEPSSINIETDLPYKDVTQEWIDAIDRDKVGKVTELDYFEKDGIRYDSSNSTLRYNKNENEKYFTELLSDTFNRDVSEVPRIKPFDNHGDFISTPDYIFDSEQWELKSIGGSGKSTIIDAVNRGSKQANNFFVHVLDKSELTEDMIETQIISLFKYKKYEFVEKIIVFIKDKLYLIAQKKR